MNYVSVYDFYFFAYISHYLKAVCLENTQRKSSVLTQGLVIPVADGSGRDVAILCLASRRSTKVGKREYFKRTAWWSVDFYTAKVQ
jgi:hypothetical protein